MATAMKIVKWIGQRSFIEDFKPPVRHVRLFLDAARTRQCGRYSCSITCARPSQSGLSAKPRFGPHHPKRGLIPDRAIITTPLDDCVLVPGPEGLGSSCRIGAPIRMEWLGVAPIIPEARMCVGIHSRFAPGPEEQRSTPEQPGSGATVRNNEWALSAQRPGRPSLTGRCGHGRTCRWSDPVAIDPKRSLDIPSMFCLCAPARCCF